MLVGISEQEARQRLEQFGPNELKDGTDRSFFKIVLDALCEPMLLILIGIGTIYLILGEIEEVFSLITFLFLIISITVFQEHKTEKTLSLLKRLSSPRAIVIRDGKQKKIPGREIVPGDLIYLSEGDRVPADLELIEGGPLSIDESILTGESYPVEKGRLISGKNQMLSGTLVIRGQAWGKVFGTGHNTEIGKIGTSLEKAKINPTPLQRQAKKMVNKLGLIALILTLFIIFYYGMTSQQWLEAILVGLTLAMAIIPNELPAVLLIFLAGGAWRISKRQVLTRRVPAVEALGGITALCVDKTGTLTQNRMIIASLWSEGKEIDLLSTKVEKLPVAFYEVLEFGILASNPHPFDPMEKALHSAGLSYLYQTEHLHPQWVITKEYPLTDELLAVSYAWRDKLESGHNIGAKGAPEAIIDLCHLKGKSASEIETQVRVMASKGLRVIGVAKAHAESLPPIQHDLNFQFMGLVGLADPIRSDAKDSVLECQQAGIKVMMITGDHPFTAQSIARQIGLDNCSEVLTGAEIDKLSDMDLMEQLKFVRIFCRMQPLQKHRIVTILQKSGEVVAMTGDGVNDAPALKKADIGIAMGERGTDVAREAASIVLLDDNFSSIVAATKIGRRTYHNLEEAFSYLLSIHIPITIISIIPVIFKFPLILLPVHVAFLHLIIEPVSTIFFEAKPVEAELMKKPPRKMNDPILKKDKIITSLFRGFWITFVVMSVFFISFWREHSVDDIRGLTFTALIFSNLALIFSFEDKKATTRKRLTPTMLTLMTVMLVSIVLYVPLFRKLFHLEFLHPADIVACISSGIITKIGLKLIPNWFSWMVLTASSKLTNDENKKTSRWP